MHLATYTEFDSRHPFIGRNRTVIPAIARLTLSVGVRRIKNSLILASPPQLHPLIFRFPCNELSILKPTGPSIVVKGRNERMRLAYLLRERHNRAN